MSQRNRPSQRASTSQRAGPSQRSQQIVSDESSDEGSHDGMADNEKHAYVQHACKYILSMTRKLVPIKPGDLIKSCFNGDKKLHTKIFPIVTNLLAELYGLELHEIVDGNAGKVIYCTSSVQPASEFEFTEQQRADIRLRLMVVSYIQMKGGVVAETTLFSFLKRLDIRDEPHATFGYFKKKLADTFVRQQYLKRTKVQIEGNNADDKFQYSCGVRAQLEFPPEGIVNAVAKLMHVAPTALGGQDRNSDSEKENDETLETSDIEIG